MRNHFFATALVLSAGHPSAVGADASGYETVEIFDTLRSQALGLQPERFGVTADDEIIAVLMETGYPGAVVTLLSAIDGSASLYFSSGGGIIGAGEHEAPNAASKKLVETAASFTKYMARTEATPLPKEGFTRFYIVTPSGLLTAEVEEEELGERRHELSPLFYTAYELFTEIRIVDEQRKKTG